MIDVFVRVYCTNFLRTALALASVERWRMESNIRLNLIITGISYPVLAQEWFDLRQIRIELPGFWQISKQTAEDSATSDYYILADDDQLIIGKHWAQRAVDIARRHPEYGILSGWSINGEVSERPSDDPEVFPVENSIGCPYIIRKGLINTFPPSEIGNQDAVMCETIKQQGLKIGMMKELRYNHLGAHYSTAMEGHWSA